MQAMARDKSFYADIACRDMKGRVLPCAAQQNAHRCRRIVWHARAACTGRLSR
jgi:hypothetical protein